MMCLFVCINLETLFVVAICLQCFVLVVILFMCVLFSASLCLFPDNYV